MIETHEQSYSHNAKNVQKEQLAIVRCVGNYKLPVYFAAFVVASHVVKFTAMEIVRPAYTGVEKNSTSQPEKYFFRLDKRFQ